MTIPRLRSAVRTALCIVLTAAGLSCDALNPTFVNQLGGNAINSVPEPTGSIVVVFNNQRTVPLMLSYTAESSPPGATSPITASWVIVAPSPGWFAITLDCNTTSVKLDSITLVGSTAQPIAAQPTTPATGNLTLATNLFTAPALQCGAVIFVNVPPIGAPTAALVP